MRLLLDTNAFVWLSDSPYASRNIGKNANLTIEASEAVYVSSISVVELHIKTMTGKMEMMPVLAEVADRAGYQLLDFSAAHADALRSFPELARHDPFDRMLLAQARTEKLTFMTADKVLLNLGLPFVVDARS